VRHESLITAFDRRGDRIALGIVLAALLIARVDVIVLFFSFGPAASSSSSGGRSDRRRISPQFPAAARPC